MLTVDQLVLCLKSASALDQETGQIEGYRRMLRFASDEINLLQAQINQKRSGVIRSSQASVDNFNADIDRYNAMVERRNSQGDGFNLIVQDHHDKEDRYNAECAEKYYATDDMESARKLAGI
jgi:hypothetical protein